MMFVTSEIRRLTLEDAAALSRLLSQASPTYICYFTPFQFDEVTVRGILAKAQADIYFGLLVERELVGFYMLRGFDEGYQVPSYGVFIAEKYANHSLGQLTLQHALCVCRLSGVKKIMLKVHPANTVAKEFYESFGFEQTGFDPRNGNFVYHKTLA